MKCCEIIIPSRSEVGVDVREGGAVLPEVAVERRREALERDPKVPVEALHDGARQPEVVGAAVGGRRGGGRGRGPEVGRVAAEEHPHAGQEVVELPVVGAAVAVQLLLEILISNFWNYL